ncbi:MAG: CBS domain-containing protein [Actinomycetia bacterium]|nr:CBS domain-containing protein [Actinomycetes bacterium]MCP5033831.1 CBS domain-containing protein [Actinomycetes bacterium]
MPRERRGSWRMMRIARIDIYLHWSWLGILGLLVLGFRAQLAIGYPELAPTRLWAYAAIGSVVFLASVLLHELAHALMAQARGIDVEGITLYLFGGATEADASSGQARDELVIAAVGPLASVGLAAVLWLVALAVGPDESALGGLIAYLAVVNLVLAAFNMTPGLPLDGGRVFRSLVWSATGDFRKATRWAASAGVAVGYFLIGIGLVTFWQGGIGGIWFAAIGWLISQSARAAVQQEDLRLTFAGLTAADVMTPGVVTIPAHSSVAEAVGTQFASANYTTFPVVDGISVIGTLSLRTIRALSQDQRASLSAGQAAVPVDPDMVVGLDTSMTSVLEALTRSQQGGRVLVFDGQALVGIISTSDVVRRNALAALLDGVRE